PDGPGEVRLYLWSAAGGPAGSIRCLTDEPGVFGGRHRAGLTVVVGQRADSDGSTVEVRRPDGSTASITSHSESPGLVPTVAMVTVAAGGKSDGGVDGGRGSGDGGGDGRGGDGRGGGLRPVADAPRTAVILPSGHRPGTKLPVLMDPYGGPHAQRVMATRGAYLTSQWFADQGFAVVVADGRGTPGRGPDYERAVLGDLAAPVLEDQVTALRAAAAQFPDLDLTRVGIRGWSFGGYLAALAVLRRPDVFHVGVAGAPVTDWALYDTHYTERYLGHPGEHPDAYRRSSLIEDAPKLTRPLLLIHGLADDNVVAAHTLRLSSALLAAGRPHTVLPLSGVTHMTPQEEVAENLLLLQVDFLRSALGSS
ncbi:MAG TPA: S9 family peptidase, partial [Pseudonocardia sp.]|nr:S9 family peptidase [Pseudonocardia sp.]